MTPTEENSLPQGNRFQRYLDYSGDLITRYKGGEPFHLYLKKYFAANKKHGSRDRKLITSLCYNYFRLGMGVSEDVSFKEKLLLGIFLSGEESLPILESIKPAWNEQIEYPQDKKFDEVKSIFDAGKIFPFTDFLSDEIEKDLFNNSFLKQPKLFVRIRPRQHKKVISKLKDAEISFEQVDANCLAFSNNQKITEILKADEEVVIQDYNSQRVSGLLQSEIDNLISPIALWDCCAASGGKSILAYDLLKEVNITVSDTRKNILENLKTRFAKAGIKKYDYFIKDLSGKNEKPITNDRFDLIIADVPCSGSGTWGRTPEQLQFFSEKEIVRYALLQKNIVENALPYLKPGGFFLYITCSVFKKENEDIVEFICKTSNLKLQESRYLKGYEMQADTLFAAMFKKEATV